MIQLTTKMYINLKSVIINKLRSFCKHCTMHGFYYFSERRPRLIYMIWSVIIILGLTLCVILSLMIWKKFSVDPTFTVVEKTRHPIIDIKFPSVTVCYNEMVYFGPNTDNITIILSKRGFTETQINEFYESFSAVQEPNYKPNAYVNNMHSFLHSLGYTWDDLLWMFKTPCEDFITLCLWRSKIQNCSAMFRHEYTYAGICCRFDINYFRQNAPADTTFTGGVEITEALKININIQNENQSETNNNNFVSMFILDEAHYVTPTDTAITLSQPAFYDVSVHVWAIDSSDDVKALPPKSRKCILEGDTAYGFNYVSYQECLVKLVLKKVVNKCHCLPFKYKANDLQTEQYPSCTWDRISCVYQNIANIQNDIQDVTADETCLTQCDYVQYETETSFVQFHRGRKTNTTNVVVHFNSNTCLKYRREVLYTWDQMLANLGGIFGLCLGGSIISIIELVWFIIDVLFTSLFVCKKNSMNPNKDERVFTISHRSPFTKDNNMRKSQKQGKFKYVN